MRTLLTASIAIIASVVTASTAFADGSSPCNDEGEFAPDPHEYYTIVGENVEVPVAAGFDGTLIAVESASLSPLSAHWRFVEDVANGAWFIRSREHGLEWGSSNAPVPKFTINLGDGPPQPREQLQTVGGVTSSQFDALPKPLFGAPIAGPFAFQAECSADGSRVILSSADPDNDQLFPRSSKVGPFLFPTVDMAPSQRVETRTTGCVKKSRSCTGQFGSAFRRVHRGLCGFLGTNHRLSCERVHPPTPEQFVPQEWSIQEVSALESPRIPAPGNIAPIVVGPIDLSSGSDALATGLFVGQTLADGALTALNTHPLTGALLSTLSAFGFGFAGGDDTANQEAAIQQSLQTLADDILRKPKISSRSKLRANL